MELKHCLNLTMRPALIMTPRLQQALKLLQVPTIELQQILKQEIMQNPLLEEVDEVMDSDDLDKENSPEEAAEKEPRDPSRGGPIDRAVHAGRGLRPRLRRRARPRSSS
jgi:RNA polymerase sigma-54 factor